MNPKFFLVLLILAPLALLFAAGSYLSFPVNHEVGSPPSSLVTRSVVFDEVRGWLVPSDDKTGRCIILMHGIRSDRTSMIERAKFFKTQGYTSLLFDFQAHGESYGDKITFGLLESKNAHSAVDFLRESGECNKIAALGVSLGGAAALLGNKPLPVDALIIESVYPSIQEAVSDRLAIRLGKLGRLLAPLLYQQIPLRFGYSLTAFSPAVAIRKIQCPIFVISGSDDLHTRISEAKNLYANAPEPKQFWEVAGAAHVDLHQFANRDYEVNILTFLSEYM